MHELRTVPMVRIAVPFCLGLAISPGSPFRPEVMICFAVLLLIPLLVKSLGSQYQHRWAKGIFFTGCIVLLGVLYGGFSLEPVTLERFPLEQKKVFCFEIAGVAERPGGVQLTGYVSTKGASPVMGILLIKDYADRIPLEINDKLLVFTRFTIPGAPKNPLQFDYSAYLRNRGIYIAAFAERSDILRLSKGAASFRQAAVDCRQSIVGRLRSAGVHGDELAIASAMLIGEEDLVSPELRSAYAATGAMHVLSVSGLHVSIIYIFLSFLFLLLTGNKKRSWTVSVLIILVLWIYAFISGWSPSVQRATLMFSLITLGKCRSRQAKTINILAGSAMFLLIVDPLLLRDIGFQLSYAALLGILLLYKPLYHLLNFRSRCLDWIWQLTAVSLAAQATAFPLGIYYFNQFPAYFLLANLVIIPASFIILGLGIFTAAFGGTGVLGSLTGTLLSVAAKWLNKFLYYVEQLPCAVLDYLYLDPVEVVLCFAAVLLAFAAWTLRSRFCLFGGSISLVLLLVFSLSHWVQNKEGLFFYCDTRHLAVGYKKHYSGYVITDAAADAKVMRNIRPHRSFFGLSRQLTYAEAHKKIPLKILADGNILMLYNDLRILLVREPVDARWYRDLYFDYLILEKKVKNHLAIVNVPAEKIIIATSLEQPGLRRLKQLYSERLVILSDSGCHSIHS